MSHRRERFLRVILAAAALVAVVGTAAARPAEVDFEEARCAMCGMRVTNRRYAAQLQTRDGAVHVFDDPGCLLRTLIERRPRVRARYFMGPGGHWIRGRDVAFIEATGTPMGYGLAAVRTGTINAISWEEAWRRVQRRVGRSGAPAAPAGHAPR